jgi:hypothetical protein
MMASFTIDLTDGERLLVEQIEFDPHAIRGPEHAQRNGELVSELMKSLAARSGVPEHRRSYFTDPDYHVGGRGSSRKAIFERHGCHGRAIVEHPDFLRHLRFFLYGANLPSHTTAAFRAAVNDCGMVTSSDIVPLGVTARSLARGLRLSPDEAREEFFKLALDCGLSPDTATLIRASAGRQ